MPSLTRKIPNESDLARRIRQEVRQRVASSYKDVQQRHKAWLEAEEAALAYLPEKETDVNRRKDRESGEPQYTTIQIPYSYAVLLSAHTYLTSVFLGRNPVMQYSARHGEAMQQVQAMEALIDYQLMVGAMLAPIYTWLYDVGKYGIGVMGLYWEDRFERISQIQQQPSKYDAAGNPVEYAKVQASVGIKTYSGNKVYNVQPWDFLWDTRVPAGEFQKGEFCAVRFALSWNECKRREKAGMYTNLDQLGPGVVQDAYASANDGAAELNKPEATGGTSQWEDHSYGSDSMPRKRPALVKGYECVIEIIPEEWGLGSSDYPEKWVFTVTADFKVLIGAQPLGAFHSKFPYVVGQLEVEGYGLVSRGYPQILKPVQDTVDWLVNSHFFNVRSALNNRVVVDPSRVVLKDVLNPLPGGVIRVRGVALGQDVRQAVNQLQVTDVTQNHLRDLQLMFGLGERTVGVNDQIMGMINTGGRKTATEIRTSTTFGVNRLKTIAEWLSVTSFDPFSQMMVMNSQQYYDGEQKFRIVGDLANSAGGQFMTVTPESIAGFYDFVPVDGTLPIDKYAQANLWKELMAQMRNFPQLMMGYDLGRIFEWVAQLAGLKNITQFKIQLAPQEQLMLAAQAGNVVPMGGGGRAGNKPPGTSGVSEPRQISGMGATG